MWYAQVRSSSMCYPSPVLFSPCVILFSFCRPLPHGACQNSTLCQATTGSGFSVLSFGTYQPKVFLQQSECCSMCTYTVIIMSPWAV